ncbi:LysR family transcriptional regulator, partial [Bosea vaviloviae]|uniref:LysR family transcriptional regulator n=1 Tax=Bosea vaviloviae TaxID=1526658 RepID=UPI0012E0DEBE
MTVELQKMQWAITVSQFRSLRQAAEKLNVRQSTLSRRMRDLEQEVGATLFERTNGGTRLTPAGQEFLETARRIIEETADLPLVCHPAAIRASAGFTPCGVGLATGDRRSWSGLRSRSSVA